MIIQATYTNWRGVRRVRYLEVLAIWWGSTTHHPDRQALVTCRDLDDDRALKDFALAGFEDPGVVLKCFQLREGSQ